MDELRPYFARLIGSQLQVLRTEELEAEQDRGGVSDASASVASSSHVAASEYNHMYSMRRGAALATAPAIDTTNRGYLHKREVAPSSTAGGAAQCFAPQSLQVPPFPSGDPALLGKAAEPAVLSRQPDKQGAHLPGGFPGNYHLFSTWTKEPNRPGVKCTPPIFGGDATVEHASACTDGGLRQNSKPCAGAEIPALDTSASSACVEGTSLCIRAQHGAPMRNVSFNGMRPVVDEVRRGSASRGYLTRECNKKNDPLSRMTTESTHCDDRVQLEFVDDFMGCSDDDLDDASSHPLYESGASAELERVEASVSPLLIKNTFWHIDEPASPVRRVRSDGDLACRQASSSCSQKVYSTKSG